MLIPPGMPEPNEPDDQVRRKVIYEHVSTSGTTRQNIVVIVVLLVLALVLVGCPSPGSVTRAHVAAARMT